MNIHNILLSKNGSNILELFTVLIIFVFVLGLTYFTTKWIGNFQKNHAVGKNIESIEVFRINNNKYIQILRTGNEYIVISVCKDSIALLNKISKEDIELTTRNTSTGQPFGQVFEHIKNLKQKNK